jgi:hypothetical protein
MLKTGYIHNMIDNNLNFKDFVFSCARAFGHLVMMRDDPMNAPIPDKFEHDTYHAKELAKAKKKYKALSAMNKDEQLAHGKKAKAWLVKMYKENLKLAEKEYKKITTMLAKVENWEVPTPEHLPLKNFMIEQLGQSNDMTYEKEAVEQAEARTEQSFYDNDLDMSKRDIEYHKEKQKQELERTNAKNDWIKALKESVENEC